MKLLLAEQQSMQVTKYTIVEQLFAQLPPLPARVNVISADVDGVCACVGSMTANSSMAAAIIACPDAILIRHLPCNCPAFPSSGWQKEAHGVGLDKTPPFSNESHC